MRCFVTGGSGHLGSHLVRLLLEKHHEVAILVRPQSNLWRIADVVSQTEIIYGDLASIALLESKIKSLAPEVIFHLAWYGVQSTYRTDIQQVSWNLMGSLKFLEIAMQSSCKCWVGIGSQAEYGRYSEILREDAPTNPATLYGTTKLCLGLLSRQICEAAGIRHLWFRLFATYGPKDDETHLIPTIILKLLAGEQPRLTFGEQQWDYLFVEDAVEAIYLTAFSDIQGIFNLGSGQAPTIRSIAELIRNEIDPLLSLGFGEVPYARNQIMQLQADISRLTGLTGWIPKTSLNEGLRRTIDSYRN